MVWSTGIARDYSLGLNDGKQGRQPRNNVEFAASYAEGYLHGSNERRNRQR